MTLPSLTEDALTAVSKPVISHAQSSLPNEAVGLIWMDGMTMRLHAETATPSSFHLSHDRLIEALSLRPDSYALGVYHSHPGGAIIPSDTDLACMEMYHTAGIDLVWPIIALYSDFASMATYRWNPEAPRGYSVIHRITHLLDH